MAALKRQNVHVACDTCHKRKVKCHSSERPCPRCKAAAVVCTFDRQEVYGPDPLPISPTTTTPLSPGDQDSSRTMVVNACEQALPVCVSTGSGRNSLTLIFLSKELSAEFGPDGGDAGDLETSYGNDGTFDVAFPTLEPLADGQQSTSSNLMDFDPFSMLLDYSFLEPLSQSEEDIFGNVPPVRTTRSSRGIILRPALEDC